ncbi:MAG TPA: succinate dehydrogenase [Casimicrobiaceae bacterium]|nr:succinate dehydrogenase [Casimicrobiaceae bacterium]
MSARAETRLWLLQRTSAAALAVCVAVHLATIIGAVRSGLSAAAILGRTNGSLGWAAFYAAFVLAVSIHAPIGLRGIAAEWLGWRGRAADAVFALIGIALLALGAYAIAAVTR